MLYSLSTIIGRHLVCCDPLIEPFVHCSTCAAKQAVTQAQQPLEVSTGSTNVKTLTPWLDPSSVAANKKQTHSLCNEHRRNSSQSRSASDQQPPLCLYEQQSFRAYTVVDVYASWQKGLRWPQSKLATHRTFEPTAYASRSCTPGQRVVVNNT